MSKNRNYYLSYDLRVSTSKISSNDALKAGKGAADAVLFIAMVESADNLDGIVFSRDGRSGMPLTLTDLKQARDVLTKHINQEESLHAKRGV